MNEREATDSGTDGASLAGLLVIVVVLGLLSAAAVIGVSSLSNDDSVAVLRGRSTGSVGVSGPGGFSSTTRPAGTTGPTPAAAAACAASASAASSASTVYFTNGGAYPARWSDLTGGPAAVFVLPDGVVVHPADPARLDGRGWKLVMTGGGATAPTFTCG